MKLLIEHLVEALREELKHYGEMLVLLDQQEKTVAVRNGAELLRGIATVDEQVNTIRIAREQREQRRRHLARTVKLDEVAGFKELTARLPADYRPLIQALVQENNDLLARVQERARLQTRVAVTTAIGQQGPGDEIEGIPQIGDGLSLQKQTANTDECPKNIQKTLSDLP